jgi:hypothetical protein
VSLELVGEFFEVKTQVDRDLTTVSRVDRRLGIIKNLGRHSGLVAALALDLDGGSATCLPGGGRTITSP